MCNFEEVEKYVKQNISEKRYIHSVNVTKRCEDFAQIYNVNIEKAKLIRNST